VNTNDAKGKAKMSDNDFYSKKNPNGPFAAHRTRPHGSNQDYIEGQSTKANLKQWTDYSLRNSDDPSITNKKLR
jgi:hypothetical protein